MAARNKSTYEREISFRLSIGLSNELAAEAHCASQYFAKGRWYRCADDLTHGGKVLPHDIINGDLFALRLLNLDVEDGDWNDQIALVRSVWTCSQPYLN